MYQHFLKKSYLLFQHKNKKHNFVIVILFLDWKFWPYEIKSFYYRILIWHKYIVQECTWISSSAVETWFLHFYSITSLIVIDEQHISDELQVHLNHALPIQGNIVTLGMRQGQTGLPNKRTRTHQDTEQFVLMAAMVDFWQARLPQWRPHHRHAAANLVLFLKIQARQWSLP